MSVSGLANFPKAPRLIGSRRSRAVFVRRLAQPLVRNRVALGAFLAVFLVVLGLGASRSAVAQTDPYSGLPTEVRAVAEAVRSGNLERILAALPTDATTVVRSAFPGSGGDVSLETAREEITALVVSDAGRSDAFGPGAYTLLAVWRPSINPGETLLIGSGIGPDGVRVSTGFGVAVRGGRGSVTSYGKVFDLSATLAQWRGQGDLRLISATTPFPPATGSGPPNELKLSAEVELVWVLALISAVAAAAVAFRTSRRRAH